MERVGKKKKKSGPGKAQLFLRSKKLPIPMKIGPLIRKGSEKLL